MNVKEKVDEIDEKLENLHYLPGPIYQRITRCKAAELLKTNELEAIYHLVESHVPGLRQKIILRYDKITSNPVQTNLTISKEPVTFKCTTTSITDNVNAMLKKIREMPPEWTIVQITPNFERIEGVEIEQDKWFTNDLFLTVFNCGVKSSKPFCVKVGAPTCKVGGTRVQLLQEMHAIIAENKGTLVSSKDQVYFKSVTDKRGYFQRRQFTDSRLKCLVSDLEELYLKEWKALLVGKYINKTLDRTISKKIEEFFKNEAPHFNLSNKTLSIVQCFIKNFHYLKLVEIKRACNSILKGDKKLQVKLAQFLQSCHDEMALHKEKKHPLILIIDDSLDCCPWEMISVLIDASVSRLPSLHLAFALFHEHKTTIKDGFKIIEKPKNGTFVVNPDLDLKNMQHRITSFFEYWVPSWKGISGQKPTEDEFEKMLLSGDVFSYNGHGAGTHFFSLQKIEKIRVKSVVLLFGCGSTKLVKVGSQNEMYGTSQMYLIACSPCVVGMLWEVTDLDTDILTTEILSNWIPNAEKTHWRHLDKTKWKKGEKVDFPFDNSKVQPHDPELLHVLSAARKSNLLSFYITKAACVARGIPIKIVEK